MGGAPHENWRRLSRHSTTNPVKEQHYSETHNHVETNALNAVQTLSGTITAKHSSYKYNAGLCFGWVVLLPVLTPPEGTQPLTNTPKHAAQKAELQHQNDADSKQSGGHS